ncbi:unnamed protein product [Cunninghamella echinulata]
MTTVADKENENAIQQYSEEINIEDHLHNDSSDTEDDESYIITDHPLQSDTSLTYNEDNQDYSAHRLLDAQGSPNVPSSNSSTNLPEFKKNEIVDKSLASGVQNAGDTGETITLAIEGQLPEWLVAEHYTVGPGTYDIRYIRKIEIDGFLQSATGTFTFGHILDSLPLVNRFDFNGKENTVRYRSRLTSRRLIEKIRDHHGYAPCHPGGLFKTHANQTVLIKFMKAASKASKPDGEPCGARILTKIPELDPFELKPTRVLTWDEINPAFQGYNACPNGHYDVETGEYINFTMEIGYRTTRYHFFSTTEQNPRGSLIATVQNAPTGYVNSFAVTKNYIVLAVFPMLAHSSAVTYAWNESILDSFSFYPSEPTVFYVISRKEKQVLASYRAPPCFSFNQVNAFEDTNGQIFVDIVAYNDDAIAYHLTTEQLRNTDAAKPLPSSQIRRYLLHNLDAAMSSFVNNQSYIPSVSSITSKMSSLWSYVSSSSSSLPTNTSNNNNELDIEQYSDNNGWYSWMPLATHSVIGKDIELPVINPNYNMKKHNFIYGLGVVNQSVDTDNNNNNNNNEIKINKDHEQQQQQEEYQRPTYWNSIVKLNINNKSVEARWHEHGCYPNEAVFIPQKSNSVGQEQEGEEKEDDGVLVSVILDTNRQVSFLLVLDASSLKVIAKCDLGTIVPISFSRGSYKLR